MSVAEDILEASILVVDDVQADARLVESILLSAGYTRIATTHDPGAVCRLHRENGYDLIVLDLFMPGMNGYEVMAELAGIESGSLPVLAMTSDPEQLQQALQSGARDCIAKPIRKAEVLARVRNLLEMHLSMKALAHRGEELERTLLEDVTERHHMEAALRAAESRFRALVEQSVAGIYTVEDGVLTYANPRMCELLGYPAEELVGLARIDLMVEEDRGRLLENRKRADAGIPGALSATYRFRRKDGAVVHLSVDAQHIDVDRRQSRLGVAQDVTEQVRTQELLREAEERYRVLVEQSLVGIYLLENGRVTYANRMLLELTGFTLKELDGLELKQVVPEQDHGRVDEILKQRQASETGSICADWHVRRKDGRHLYVRIESKVIELAGRKVALGVVQDVTEQTLAAGALRQSEEKYRLLWETSTDAVILMGEDMRIHYANPSMQRVFGYAPEEVEGRDIALLQPERMREPYRRAMKRYLETGVKTLDWRATEIVGLHRDGREFPVEMGISRLTIGGVAVFAGFMRDITERKHAQAALESANRRLQVLSERVLEVQEEERRLLSSELHDDVGQSLLALQIGLHRLAQRSVRDKPQLLSECVDIVTAVQDKLREVSVRLHPPQLGQLGLQDALRALVSRQRATTGLDIRYAFEGPEKGELSPQVEIACYRICQEALNNATRHARAGVIEVRTKRERDRLRLSVRDDGTGFDTDARREAANASGNLGLISMEERARLAGGEIELRTAPGAGTVVIAMFPCDMAATAAAAGA